MKRSRQEFSVFKTETWRSGHRVPDVLAVRYGSTKSNNRTQFRTCTQDRLTRSPIVLLCSSYVTHSTARRTSVFLGPGHDCSPTGSMRENPLGHLKEEEQALSDRTFFSEIPIVRLLKRFLSFVTSMYCAWKLEQLFVDFLHFNIQDFQVRPLWSEKSNRLQSRRLFNFTSWQFKDDLRDFFSDICRIY